MKNVVLKNNDLKEKLKRIFIYAQRKKRIELLVFSPHFWVWRLRGINNAKNDNKYNNTIISTNATNATQDQEEFERGK